MNYPTMDQAKNADSVHLGRWMRFLPLSSTDEEYEILVEISRRFDESGGWNPLLSKLIGDTYENN